MNKIRSLAKELEDAKREAFSKDAATRLALARLSAMTARAATAESELARETKLRMFFERALHQLEENITTLDNMTSDKAVELIFVGAGYLKGTIDANAYLKEKTNAQFE